MLIIFYLVFFLSTILRYQDQNHLFTHKENIYRGQVESRQNEFSLLPRNLTCQVGGRDITVQLLIHKRLQTLPFN